MNFRNEALGDVSDMSDATFPDKWLFAVESKICDRPIGSLREMGNIEESGILASLASRSVISLTRPDHSGWSSSGLLGRHRFHDDQSDLCLGFSRQGDSSEIPR